MAAFSMAPEISLWVACHYSLATLLFVSWGWVGLRAPAAQWLFSGMPSPVQVRVTTGLLQLLL